jgi:hypothetical protein
MKVKSGIVVLIGLFVLTLIPFTSTVGQDDDTSKLKFVGHKKCRMCHNMKKNRSVSHRLDVKKNMQKHSIC